MAVEVQLRKWGNSRGVIIPNRFIEERKLKDNDKFFIEIIRVADLSNIFGSLKLDKHISGQKFKDIARKGWENESDRKRRGN